MISFPVSRYWAEIKFKPGIQSYFSRVTKVYVVGNPKNIIPELLFLKWYTFLLHDFYRRNEQIIGIFGIRIVFRIAHYGYIWRV